GVRRRSVNAQWPGYRPTTPSGNDPPVRAGTVFPDEGAARRRAHACCSAVPGGPGRDCTRGRERILRRIRRTRVHEERQGLQERDLLLRFAGPWVLGWACRGPPDFGTTGTLGLLDSRLPLFGAQDHGTSRNEAPRRGAEESCG